MYTPMGKLACMLLVIGGLNWGVVGLTGKDLVGGLFGARSALTRAVYIVVGLAAVFFVAKYFGVVEGFAAHTTLPHAPPCHNNEKLNAATKMCEKAIVPPLDAKAKKPENHII